MNIQRGAILYLDAKPAPGIVVECTHKSFMAYFPSVDGEEAEVLEFEHRNQIDPGELNIIVSQDYRELTGSTIPEGGEFFINGNRAIFAVVRIFRVVPFTA